MTVFSRTVLLLLVVTACGEEPPGEAQEVSSRLEFTSSDSVAITRFVDSLLVVTNGASISLAVGTREDGLRFETARGFGNIEDSIPATPESQYRMGSVSKVLGGTLLFTFVEDGRVRLDDEIQAWVPSFPDKSHPITVRNVLTHTAGIRHYGNHPQDRGRHDRDFQSFEEAIGLFKDSPLLHEPGTAWLYSSYGFNLVQGILEAVGEAPVEQVMDSLLFKPLGMSSTLVETYGDRPPGLVQAYYLHPDTGELTIDRPGNPSYKKIAGGIVSTPRDMVDFMLALGGGGILSNRTLASMMERPYEFAPGQAHGWFYGESSTDGEPYYHHGGTTRGFVAFVMFMPGRDVYVAVAANYADFYDVRSDLAGFLVDMLAKARERGVSGTGRG